MSRRSGVRGRCTGEIESNRYCKEKRRDETLSEKNAQNPSAIDREGRVLGTGERVLRWRGALAAFQRHLAFEQLEWISGE